MSISERIENDLRMIVSSSLSSNIKRNIERAIYELRTCKNSTLIIDDDHPFISVFSEISKEKKYLNEIVVLLSILRILIETGSIDGNANTSIFSIIDGMIPKSNDNILLKIIQISIAAFLSPNQGLDMRFVSMRWIFLLSNHQSQTVSHVSTAASYQIIDIFVDHIISINHNSIKTNDEALGLSSETNSDSEYEQLERSKPVFNVSSEIWSIRFMNILISDFLLFATGKDPIVFVKLIRNIEYAFDHLIYFFNKHFEIFLSFNENSKEIIGLIFELIDSQKELEKFSALLPHILIYLFSSNQSRVTKLFMKSLEKASSYPRLLNAYSIFMVCDPASYNKYIGIENRVFISKLASNYFLSNFRGVLGDSIIPRANISNNLQMYNHKDSSSTSYIVSSIRLLFLEIIFGEKDKDSFISLFSYFETVWQRVIQTLDDSQSIAFSLKAARRSIRSAVRFGLSDPPNRLFSTLCGISIPSSSSFPLGNKAILSLSTIVALTKQLRILLSPFWGLIFKTISQSYYSASAKRSSSDHQAMSLMDPEEIFSFSSSLNDENFLLLFNTIISISIEDSRILNNNKGSFPNLWAIRSLCFLFVINSHRSILIEKALFGHIKVLILSESSELRTQSVNILYSLAKEIINNDSMPSTTREMVFDYLLQTGNSTFHEVAVTSFISLFSMLADGTSHNIKEGWPKLLTMLKSVWASPFTENIQNGFRVLSFICNDCLELVGIGSIDLCLSTLSSYVCQANDINTSLGSIGLFWDIGSRLVPVESQDHIYAWKSLIRSLQSCFFDSRPNVSISSLSTFFSLISTFHQHFTEDITTYIIEKIMRPLFSAIQKESQDKNNMIHPEVTQISLQNGIQCLKFFGETEMIISHVIPIIENICFNMFEERITNDSVKCMVTLFSFGNQDIVRGSTFSLEKIVNYFRDTSQDSSFQASASVMSDVLPNVINIITMDEFEIWMRILKTFATYKIDRPYLNVATHVALNMISQLPLIQPEKSLSLSVLLSDLITLNFPPLSSKSYETLSIVYERLLNEQTRAKSLTNTLPILKPCISQNDCFKCLSTILSLKYDNTILIDDTLVFLLVDISRKIPSLRSSISIILTSGLHLISEKSYQIVLSQTYLVPSVLIAYLKEYCFKGISENILEFSLKFKKHFFQSIESNVKRIIDEEKAMKSVLPKSRYDGLMIILSSLSSIMTDYRVFSENENRGHIVYILPLIAKLTTSYSPEIRATVSHFFIDDM